MNRTKPTIFYRLVRSYRKRTHVKVVVTTGVVIGCTLTYYGMHEHALAAAFITNLIWIWE